MHHLKSQSICSILSFEGSSGALGFSVISLLSTTTPCANIGTHPSTGDSANNPELPSMLSLPLPNINLETGRSNCGGLVLTLLPAPPPALPRLHQHLLSHQCLVLSERGTIGKGWVLSQSWLFPDSVGRCLPCLQTGALPFVGLVSGSQAER